MGKKAVTHILTFYTTASFYKCPRWPLWCVVVMTTRNISWIRSVRAELCEAEKRLPNLASDLELDHHFQRPRLYPIWFLLPCQSVQRGSECTRWRNSLSEKVFMPLPLRNYLLSLLYLFYDAGNRTQKQNTALHQGSTHKPLLPSSQSIFCYYYWAPQTGLFIFKWRFIQQLLMGSGKSKILLLCHQNMSAGTIQQDRASTRMPTPSQVKNQCHDLT